MKIGILTFHWGTNYGAILQAFALQEYLKRLGHDVYIINYRPRQYKKTLLNCFATPRIYHWLSRIKEYIKEHKLEKFRKKYLHETILYESLDELKNNPPQFHLYITGSDQVWNPNFTKNGEGKPTTTYFLDFGDDSIKRIAYAVSFGCEDYPKEAAAIAKQYINSFHAIGVRENSGISIMKKMGYMNPVKLPDSTFLLHKNEYPFIKNTTSSVRKKAFVYILRNEFKEMSKLISDLGKDYQIESDNKFLGFLSVEEWVIGIMNASICVTNSFHGMVFSLIFHVPFIVVLSDNAKNGMNDRFKTLLSYLKLEHRIIYEYTFEKLNTLIEEKIEWQQVDMKFLEQRNNALSFFENTLK